jgi:hypothetical protein
MYIDLRYFRGGVTPEELLVPRFQSDWRQEDFIAIWSASFCVDIRCQETTSEYGES